MKDVEENNNHNELKTMKHLKLEDFINSSTAIQYFAK